MRSADVLVIGAGVLGTFHAYHAARSGLRVLLIERNAWPYDASTRNFGIIAQSIVEPGSVWAEYARETRAIYAQIQSEQDITVRTTGSLYLASTDLERQVLAEYAEPKEHAEHCTFLSAAEAVERYPFIQPDYCRGALLFPDDLALDPRHLLRRVIPYLEATGMVTYVPKTLITCLRVDGDRCRAVDARGADFEAEHSFVCTGAEYHTLFPSHLRADTTKICKLQMVRTVPLERLHLPHTLMSGLSIRRYPAFMSCPSYERLCAEPIDQDIAAFDIHVLIKQEIDGSIVIGDSHQYLSADEAANLEERTNPAINDAILRYARRMIRLPEWRIAGYWNGYYAAPRTPSDAPVTVEGRIHLAASIGGRGMTVGPGYARRSIERALP
jgi:FAD dependent oxidoreductase TIGR03364